MHPGRGYLYGRGHDNGSGFRYGGPGQCQPYRPLVPLPPEQQMTPQEREAVLMAAGRLAAEYLVNRGDLPPNVLENRPPAPIPFLGAGGQGQPAFGSRYPHPHPHPQPPVPRTSHFQGRPPAPQHREPQPWAHPSHFGGQQRPPAPQRRFPGRGPFQGGRGPFQKRPRHQRPSPYGPTPGPAPPRTRYAGQAATASKTSEDNEQSAPPGEARDSQPTAQLDVPASGEQQTDEPSSSSIGANASESS